MLAETPNGGQVPLNSMMMIFRNNFTEMIKITTTVRLQKDDEHRDVYNASVHVLCVKRVIVDGDDTRAPDFQRLKAMCNGPDADMAERKLQEHIAEAQQRLDELDI